jgi:hypothetical protein
VHDVVAARISWLGRRGEELGAVGSFWRGNRLSGWGVRGPVALVGKFMKRGKQGSRSYIRNKLNYTSNVQIIRLS